MILNSFAVLDCSVAALRLIAGLFALWLGLLAWRASRTPGAEEQTSREDRYYLLSWIALTVLALNIVSWPLLYLLLRSYIPEWPGVMCIYGVTQIGQDSIGPARFLPGLIWTLQWFKPLLIFFTGSWFALYLLNRGTHCGVLTSRVLLAVSLCGAITVADASIELAYLVIPKKEEALSSGCCAAPPAEGKGEASGDSSVSPRVLDAGFFCGCLAMSTALAWCSQRARFSRGLLLGLAVAASATFWVGRTFLTEVAAPEVLHLPYHHCSYDLIEGASETMLGIAFFVWGTLCVGWACVAGCLGRAQETVAALPYLLSRISAIGCYCYASAAVMAALELVLA